MALFDKKSRYVRYAKTYETVDRRGRTVKALIMVEKPALTELGEHQRKQGQRLDHLSNFYYKDPNGFWRIAELNDVMLPDALAESDIIKIPTRL